MHARLLRERVNSAACASLLKDSKIALHSKVTSCANARKKMATLSEDYLNSKKAKVFAEKK